MNFIEKIEYVLPLMLRRRDGGDIYIDDWEIDLLFGIWEMDGIKVLIGKAEPDLELIRSTVHAIIDLLNRSDNQAVLFEMEVEDMVKLIELYKQKNDRWISGKVLVWLMVNFLNDLMYTEQKKS